MSIKYVVFDWDGTLADTYPVISAAYDYTFDQLGLPRIPYDEVKRLTSTLQNKDTLGFIFKERKDEASRAYYEYIAAHHATNLQAMPSAKEVLEFCRNQGLKTYLITNKKTLYIKEEILKLGFQNMFDKVIAAGEYAEDKPHPIATHAVFDGNLPPADEILVLGDGEADIKTAATYAHNDKKAFCVIYDPKDKFSGSMPNAKIKNLKQVIGIITKINGLQETKCLKNLTTQHLNLL